MTEKAMTLKQAFTMWALTPKYTVLARLTAADVMAWRNFGKGCFEELNEVMKVQGVEFRKA